MDQAVLSLVEEQMQKDNETTALQLHHHLEKNSVSISLPTVLRSRQKLGWTFRGTHYCQMIREVNKSKRLEWAREYLHDDFSDVMWTDETTVQLESHKCYCCRKQGAAPKPKPHPKHPLKVHVWGGISTNGRTELVIFEGIMNASLYLDIIFESWFAPIPSSSIYRRPPLHAR